MNFVWIFKKLLKILKMRTNSNFLQKSANSKREGIFKYLQISNCKVDFCKKIASSKRESEFSNICKFQSLKFWILSEYLKNCNDLWKTKTSVYGNTQYGQLCRPQNMSYAKCLNTLSTIFDPNFLSLEPIIGTCHCNFRSVNPI